MKLGNRKIQNLETDTLSSPHISIPTQWIETVNAKKGDSITFVTDGNDENMKLILSLKRSEENKTKLEKAKKERKEPVVDIDQRTHH